MREKDNPGYILGPGKFPLDYYKRGYLNPALSNMLKHNNCLLYTSPSPRDRTRSRMPSSA